MQKSADNGNNPQHHGSCSKAAPRMPRRRRIIRRIPRPIILIRRHRPIIIAIHKILLYQLIPYNISCFYLTCKTYKPYGCYCSTFPPPAQMKNYEFPTHNPHFLILPHTLKPPCPPPRWRSLQEHSQDAAKQDMEGKFPFPLEIGGTFPL